MPVSQKFELRNTAKGKSLFALEPIAGNEVVVAFEKNFLDAPTETSMQVDEHVHQEATAPDALENFLNHACKPNGYVEFLHLTYRALRTIEPGEELTFNYNATEWDMVKGFQCQCHCQGCYGRVQGWKYLTFVQQKEIEPWLSPFLMRKHKIQVR